MNVTKYINNITDLYINEYILLNTIFRINKAI